MRRLERWLTGLESDSGLRLSLIREGCAEVVSHRTVGTLDPTALAPGYYRIEASTGERWQGQVGGEVSARGQVSERVQSSVAGQIEAAAAACDSLAETCSRLHSSALEVLTEVMGLLASENRELRSLVLEMGRPRASSPIDTGKLIGAIPEVLSVVQPGRDFEPDAAKIADWLRPFEPTLASTIAGQRGPELAETIRFMVQEVGGEGIEKLLSSAQPFQRAYLLRVLDWAKRLGGGK